MVLIRKFGAQWCKSCTTLDQQLHDYIAVAKKDPAITIEYIDIDEDTSYDHISKLPSIHIFNNAGECIHILEGLAACLNVKTLVVPDISIDADEDF